MAVEEVCVISGQRCVFTQNRSAGGKASDINLTNDEEEGFSAMRRGRRGGSALI